VRCELDDRNEKLGYRIRESQVQKIPFMLVVGAREEEAGTVAVRLRGGEDLGAEPVDGVATRIRRLTESRSREL
jgi:threonyl-tRNA synthetase